MPRRTSKNLGGSLAFNGSTSKVTMADDKIGVNPVSISAWIKYIPGVSANGRIVDNGTTIFAVSESLKSIYIASDGSSSVFTATGSLPLNVWNHVVATRTSAGVANLYINGVLSGSANQNSGTPIAATTNTIIGNRNASDRSFSGRIDSVRIFNRVLTTTEIATLYSNDSPPSSGQIFYAPLNEMTGTSAADVQGGTTGTITAGTWSSDSPAVGRRASTFIGGSTSFNGTSSGISATLPIVYTNGFSMSFWYYQHGPLVNGARVLDNQDAGPVNGFRWQQDPASGLNFVTGTGGVAFIPQPGRWYHLVGTNSATNGCKLYVDGILRSTSTSSTPTQSAAAFSFGKRSVSASNYFSGKLADVRVFQSELTAEQVSTLFFTRKTNVAPLAVYPLSETPSTYVDTVGGNNGTGTSTTYSPDTPTQLRKVASDDKASLSFDGADTDNVDTGVNVSTKIPTDFTISQVVKTRNNGANASPLFEAVGSGANRFYLQQKVSTPGSYTIGIYSWNEEIAYQKNNEWQRVTVVLSETTGKVYINGQLVRTVTGITLGTANANLILGNNSAKNLSLFGKIKSTYVWNTALTPQQIRDLHFSNVVPRTGLVGEWLLNEGAGSTAYDTSGNGNNGTITGATWSSDTPSKKRKVVGGNMVPNGDFSYIPVVNVATTTSGRWLDGTAGGSTTNIFKWATQIGGANGAGMFDATNLFLEKPSVKVSTTGTNTNMEVGVLSANNSTETPLYGIPCLPSTSYIGTVWMKTSYISGDATSGAFAEFVERLPSGSSVAANPTTKVKTTTGWTQYSVTFTTGATSRFICPRVRVTGNDGAATLIMDAWFSNITLTKTTPESRTAVT